MNRKQITEAMKAGETVAYSRYKGTAREVKVLDPTATRLVASGTSPRSSPGVKIEYVAGSQVGKTDVVQSRQLVSTWAEYLESLAVEQDREAEKNRIRNASKASAEKHAARLAALYTAATGSKPGFGMIEVVGNGFRSGNRYFETSQYSVRVSPVVLDAVLGG